MITGFNHLTLSVKDLDLSFAFYRDILGLRPLCRWAEGAYFCAGDLWLCLSLNTAHRAAKGYTHYAFSIAGGDFELFKDKIREQGVKTWKENRSEGKSLYILDPDEHQLEIHVGTWQTRLEAKKKNPWPGAEFYE